MKNVFHDCTCIKETSMAILVTDSCGSQAWIPLSQVHDDSEVYREDTEGDLVVKEWFAEKITWDETPCWRGNI